MHNEVHQYLTKAKETYPEMFDRKHVLEFGSHDINGTPRGYFTNCIYYGIDKTPGGNVDIVARAHEFAGESADVIVCTEMLEHDKYADESVANMLKHLKKGGLLIVTTANINRPPHCIETGEDGHYENISRERVEKWGTKVKILDIDEDDGKQDIRFIFKK